MLTGWAKAWPGPGETSAGFWISGAAEKDGAVPETASGGSTFSTYDNLDKVSEHQRMDDDVTGGHLETNDPGRHIGACEEEAELEEAGQRKDSSSSWSSCDVLPLDKSDDAVGAVGPPDVSPKKPDRLPSSQVAEEEKVDNDEHEGNNNGNEDDDEDDDDDENIQSPNSPTSGSVRSDSPLSTGSSEVFLPSGPSDLQGPEPQSQPRDAHSVLAELRQQMAQQRSEYQTRIQRWDTRTRTASSRYSLFL